MKRLMGCVAMAAISASAWAGITTELDEQNGRYLVTVSDHEESNVLTASQIAELGSYTLVKLGSGTLYAKGELKDFTGDIIISNGYFNVSHTNALGTAEGATYVDGGTLINSIACWQSNGTQPTFPNEKIHLKGTGEAANGALQNKVGNVDFCRNVYLEGETTINTLKNRLDFRSTTFDMNGYDLTVTGTWGNFYLVNLTMKHPGNITMNGGTFEFQSTINGNCSGKQVTINNGASLSLWSCQSWVNYDVIFNKDSKISINSGNFKEYGTDNRNVLNGTNTLNDMVCLNIVKDRQMQLAGKVTGPGGFYGNTKGYLQFTTGYGASVPASITNDFQGGVAVSGFITNGCPVGGVVVYNNRAIPTDGGALALTNAVFWKHTADVLALPDVVADGCSMITSSVSSTAISTAKTLTKTGDGALTINMPLKIVGDTEVKGGTLCFGQQIPEHPKGLNWTYNGASQGIDENGVSYAYKSWPVNYPTYVYEGFIKVPGEEGENVTCNWMTSIARGCKVTIDGTVCANFSDNKNVKDNIAVGWNRLAMYKPVTLKAGWRELKVEMSNWWDGTRGPQANKSLGWEANFAIGVDWQSRCVTNTAYYAKLLDPGDGSFLRASNSETDKIDLADGYRPSFGGSVAFAGGTTLDLNDYEPYVALTIPSLIGLPTITNGSVKVTSTTWQLRGSDLASGEPLTIAANAVLQFGDENSVVTITGDADDWRSTMRKAHKSLSAKIVRDNGATAIKNTFALDPALTSAGWSLTQSGNELTLSRNLGLMLLVK